MEGTAATPDRDARAVAHGAVIAVIEDDVQIRHFLRATLVNQGYPCLEATTGAEGLLLASSRQPDLILLDLALPDIDGVQAMTEPGVGYRFAD